MLFIVNKISYFMKNKTSKTLYCKVFPDCYANKLRLWECPSFLFLFTGAITIVGMVITYILADIYASTEIVIFSVIAVTLFMMIVGYFIMQGVSKITNAKISAEQEKKKTEAIVMNLSDGLIVLDSNNQIILLNPKAKQYLGLENKIIDLKLNSEEINNLKKIIEKTSQKKETFYDNVLIESPEKKYLKIATSPVYDSRGLFLGHVKVLHDVTREKEIDKMKSEFISIASHQLRSPLSNLKWLLEIMKKQEIGQINQEQQKIINLMDDSNKRLIKLVQELLNISRIEEGKIGFDLKKLDLNKIIQEVINDLLESAKQKNIKINFSKQELPQILIDQDTIRMVIQNLIDNAIKYTKSNNPIEINSKIDNNNIIVSVKDSGIGIPQKDQPKIFSKFHRSQNAKNLAVNGTGLGLYIAKQIIEKHKGKIWFNSKENQGTSFYISLPLAIK